MNTIIILIHRYFNAGRRFLSFLSYPVFLGRSLNSLSGDGIVFFPVQENVLHCGLAGIVSVKTAGKMTDEIRTEALYEALEKTEKCTIESYMRERNGDQTPFENTYLGGENHLVDFFRMIRDMKKNAMFSSIYFHEDVQGVMTEVGERLTALMLSEESALAGHAGRLKPSEVECAGKRQDTVKDIAWCINREILDNVGKVQALISETDIENITSETVKIYRNINAVLNSIDRLEVRGRDSAGISLLFMLKCSEYDRFRQEMEEKGLADDFAKRSGKDVLINNDITIHISRDEAEEEAAASPSRTRSPLKSDAWEIISVLSETRFEMIPSSGVS